MSRSPDDVSQAGASAAHGPGGDAARRRPTLDDVARRAGVSRTVASRAMNNTRDVSAAKREAVRQAAQELGYAPNSSARALATKRVGSVVLAVVDEEPALFSDPFFSQVVVGITTVLARAELDLTLMLASSASSRERFERLLRSPDTDGVMMMAPQGDDPLVRVAENSAVPVVFGGRPLHGRADHYVDVDNRSGAREAVEHLLGAGRRRVAAITGPASLEASVARQRGFTDALAVAGLRADLVEESDFSFTGGQGAMARLLAARPDLDAVFAASDSMAAGALRALKTHGRSVPADVAVVGFDDLPLAEQSDPPLTTVHQPFHAFGHEIATMLVRLIDGEATSPLILPTRLIIRESAP